MIMKILPRVDPSRPYLKEAAKFIRKEKVGPEKVPVSTTLLKFFDIIISDHVACCKAWNYANGFFVHKQEPSKRKRSIVNNCVATRFAGRLSTPCEKICIALHIEVIFISSIAVTLSCFTNKYLSVSVKIACVYE